MTFMDVMSFVSSAAVEAVSFVWMELAIFAAASFIYVACVGLPHLGPKTASKNKLKHSHEESHDALETYHQWKQAKKSIGLYTAVHAMRQLHKTTKEVDSELRSALDGMDIEAMLSEVEALPAALLRDNAIDLVPAVLAILQEFGKPADSSTYASLMAAQLRQKDLSGVFSTAAELPESSLTPKMQGLLTSAAVQSQDLDKALQHLREIPSAEDGMRCVLSASSARQVLELATRKQRTAEASEELNRIGAQPTPDTSMDLQRAIALIKTHARNKDLPSATAVFDRIRNSGVPMRTPIYNGYLDACVQSGDEDASLKLFEEMKMLCFVDVVSYNTLLKAHLSAGRMREARALVREMDSRGFAANKVTYNELLNAMVTAKDRQGMWEIVDEMKRADLRVNLITCSILLKSLTPNSGESDLPRIMALIDNVDEPIDDILLASIIEACIRTKQLDILSDFLARYRSKAKNFAGLSAFSYGAMIKAYGEAGNVHQVRELWALMQGNDVKPTATTIGCVVEALVVNKQPDEAWRLCQEQLEHPDRKAMINTVVYSSVLKGFAAAKRMSQVMSVYKDIRKEGIPCNTITYNTLLDACAKCASMDLAAGLLEDMRASSIEPDIITYSTIIKGYCISGDVTRALSVLKEMKQDGHFTPDEIMYNSLLDGCAKQRNLPEALRVFEEMQDANIKPSNFTLSILVKLLGNARRLGQAIQTVQELSAKHGLRLNIQVYTCLVHACIQNRRLERALAVHEDLIKERCHADEKFYGVLVKGCLQLHQPLKAIDVIRAAYKLSGGSLTSGPRIVGVEALEEMLQKISKEEPDACMQLTKELEQNKIRTTSHVRPWHSNDRRKGGGKGKP
eukprot:TRINITY_DN8377_c0_g1_i1.p1 TRINITY_DN8377_c0_g1~~TRINITY_DN8377_c0_g1_i1.p1  ORF type:complete len:853 (-),score=199.84 TRINITY_DN8377_c0_g1_i1:178-2736(-)